MLSKIIWFILLLSLIIFCVTFFTKGNYKKINGFEPEILKDAIKTDVKDKNSLLLNSPAENSSKKKFNPLSDIEVSGLVAKKSENWLILFWGGSLKSNTYKNIKISKTRVTFPSQEDYKSKGYVQRFIIYTNSKEVNSILEKVRVGDQVKLKGQIISDGSPGDFIEDNFCRDIYIKNIEILKKGNVISYNLFIISFWFFITTAILSILWASYKKSIGK